jgi:hypothetical protein
MLEAPGDMAESLGSSRARERGGMGLQVVRSRLPTTTIIGEMCWHELLPGLACFKLVVPPLQSEVVGPYSIWGVWFPNHLLLVGTDHNCNTPIVK